MLRYNSDYHGRHLDLFLKNIHAEPLTTYRLTFDRLGGAVGCWVNHCFVPKKANVFYFERCDRWTPSEVCFTTTAETDKQAAFENWGLSFFKKMDSRLITGTEETFIDNVHLFKDGEPSVDLLDGGDFEMPSDDAAYEKNWYPMFIGPIGRDFGVGIVTDPLNADNHCLHLPKVISSITYPPSVGIRAITFGTIHSPMPVSVAQNDPIGANEHWLLFSQRGSIRLTVGEDTVTVGSGGGVFVPRGLPSSWTFVQASEAAYYWVAFDGRMVDDYLRNEQLTAPRAFTVSDLSVLTECIDKMLSFPTDTPFYPYAISGYLQVLLAELGRPSASHQPSERELVIAQTAARLREQPELPLSNAELAEGCGFSTAHFVRLFRQYTGETPHRYRLNALMNKACLLLRDTSLSVKEIATTLQMENPLYFSNAFRHFYGISPTAYRKQNRQ